MSTPRPSEAYYEAHAEQYARDTVGIDMAEFYEAFLALVPPGGHILDAGCGSGRDAREFKRRGYRVTAMDASAEMARVASAVVGEAVEVRRFQDVDAQEAFDGIWTCASLLHVPSAEMNDVFARLTRALRAGGTWYMSFKAGEQEEVRDGRFFHDFTEAGLRDLVEGYAQLALIRVWQTDDRRVEQTGRKWVNALVRKSAERG
jgi:SAM-dependent methyltransferase